MTLTPRLLVLGGLCNRLRALLSCRAAYGAIDVVWEPVDMVSHARFDDVFEPLADVHFVDGDRGWDLEAWAPVPGAPEGWERGYKELFPCRPILDRFDALVASLGGVGNYAAIHVRRTDHVPNMATMDREIEPLGEYLEWAPGRALPLYVATDNGETQDAILRARGADGLRTKFGKHLPGLALQGLEDHTRNGELSDAVVDLWVCRHAAHFKGTTGSSFTDTINILRAMR